MSFSEALEEIKRGKKVRRRGWNGKCQYIILGHMCACILGDNTILKEPFHNDTGNQFLMFVGTRGYQCGWLASQADLLAEDWEVL